jgi:hypothetical protein
MNAVDLDEAKVPTTTKHKPPAYGEAARDAVKSIMDGLATEMANRIGDVRKKADELEQMMLSSTANAKGTLDETITILQSVGDECARLGAMLDEAMTGHKRLKNGG